MASNETRTRKRRKSAASESVPSLTSQDSIFEGFDGLDMSSQPDDSTSDRLFKIPRRSSKKEVPTGTIATENWNILKKVFFRVTDFLM